MRTLQRTALFGLALALALTLALAAVAFPAAASALDFEIVNESDRPASEVYVTVSGDPSTYDVDGMVNEEPKRLSEIPGQEVRIDKLVSGRVYVSYGAGVRVGVPFDSPIRFDWAELTVIPSSYDVANLTAVDMVGIGMRLDTFDGSGNHLEELSAANSKTMFAALQKVPGGPAATIRDGAGEILRVLSPIHSSAYPQLGDYVRSMSGRTITLRTAFFGVPFTTTNYTGTFQPDGSIALHGTTNPPSSTPATIEVPGPQLIEDIYTGGNTPNTIEGAIRRDLLAGFSTGLWGGKYGNDALSFCINPVTTPQGSFCPSGFNQPAFGDARLQLSPFPTCEQYAAVVNELSDVYGNPYSDASKRVTVSLDQPASGGPVTTLRLTVLPDSGNAKPVAGGNSNCGAGEGGSGGGEGGGGGGSNVTPGPAVPSGPTGPRVRFLPRPRVKSGSARIARLTCPAACGRVRAVAKQGGKVVGRAKLSAGSTHPWVRLDLTGAGKAALSERSTLKVTVRLWVSPGGSPGTQVQRRLTLIAPRRLGAPG